jgi:hypothetical protein
VSVPVWQGLLVGLREPESEALGLGESVGESVGDSVGESVPDCEVEGVSV